FTFTVSDGAIDSAPAAVNLTVSGENDAPVATAQSATTAEDTALPLLLAGADVDGDPLTFTVIDQPAHGALSGVAPDLTFTPAANYHGADAFSFKVNDGSVDSTVMQVQLTISSVNDAPVATAESATLAEDGSTVVALSGADLDGDLLTFAVATQPA